jgi:hypothetical protein
MAKTAFVNPFTCASEITDSSLVGFGTDHPIGLSMDELCYLAFKVKDIKIDGSNVVGVSGSTPNEYVLPCTDPASSAGTFSTDTTIYQASNPTSELDLVCTLPVYNYTGNSNISINLNSVYFYNDYYYPYIVISSRTHTSLISDVSGAITDANSFYADPIRGWPPISYLSTGDNLTLDLFGTSSRAIPMYLTGFSFLVTPRFAGGGFVGPAYAILEYNDAYGQYIGGGYSFSATGSTTIGITENSTWPYNP